MTHDDGADQAEAAGVSRAGSVAVLITDIVLESTEAAEGCGAVRVVAEDRARSVWLKQKSDRLEPELFFEFLLPWDLVLLVTLVPVLRSGEAEPTEPGGSMERRLLRGGGGGGGGGGGSGNGT